MSKECDTVDLSTTTLTTDDNFKINKFVIKYNQLFKSGENNQVDLRK